MWVSKLEREGFKSTSMLSWLSFLCFIAIQTLINYIFDFQFHKSGHFTSLQNCNQQIFAHIFILKHIFFKNSLSSSSSTHLKYPCIRAFLDVVIFYQNKAVGYYLFVGYYPFLKHIYLHFSWKNNPVIVWALGGDFSFNAFAWKLFSDYGHEAWWDMQTLKKYRVNQSQNNMILFAARINTILLKALPFVLIVNSKNIKVWLCGLAPSLFLRGVKRGVKSQEKFENHYLKQMLGNEP